MSAIWHRLFYRNGKSEAFAEGPALDRALARKVPIVVHRELAIIHECMTCGQRGPWGPDWVSYPIWARIADKHPPGLERVVYCSALCWRAQVPDLQMAAYIDLNHEPDRDQARNSAYWLAKREAPKAADHRKVPMPPWRGDGFCKWCNLEMRPADKPRRYWHAACAAQWLLHADPNAQRRFLIRRDGPGCAIEGCESRGFEVDHRRPLWSVRDLPWGQRRVYFGPLNLWLLCNRHHAEKTKREAGDRAAIRAAQASASDQA